MDEGASASPGADHPRAIGTDHLRAIGGGARPAGSAGEARARAYCRAVLERHGFSVAEEPFEYSDAVGRFATPLIGAASAGILVAAAALAMRGAAASALATLLGGALMLAGAGWWLARYGTERLPVRRRRGVNLVATRGEAEGEGAPRIWLVAHVDSKSQPVPMLARVSGVVGTAVVWLAAIGLAFAELIGGTTTEIWPWLAAAGIASALPVIATTVGDRSDGALDNGSGVAAVLAAAAMAPARLPLGVLVTSAEELGLAGARAWARRWSDTRAPATAVNVDGVDDDGALVCMHGGRRSWALVESARRAADALGVALDVRRTIPGVLTDGVALADAGWAVVTMSRGTWGTLARIHTERDTLDALRGDGIDAVARLIAATVEDHARWRS